jgi:hypothetical protein
VPAGWLAAVGRSLLSTRWFTRRVVIEDWFLHARLPALRAEAAPSGPLEAAAGVP